MRPTEILTNEHRIIKQVLTCLEKMADVCERDGRIDADPARKAVVFFRTFADRCHHAKEETELFSMMEARGYSPNSGPTTVMRHEHEQCRQFVSRIEGTIEGAAAGHAEETRKFVVYARAYIELLREHVDKEERCLFPLANQVLNVEDQQVLLRRFEQVERKKIGEAVHKSSHQLADTLADRFDVPRSCL